MKPVHKLAGVAVAALALAVPAAAVTVHERTGETIYGTVRGDRIDARGGGDRIFAFAGNDVVTGGAGVDRIEAGAGSDVVRARDGRNDVVSAGLARTPRSSTSSTPSVAARVVRRPPPLRRRRLRLSRVAGRPREPEARNARLGDDRRRAGPRDRGLHRAQRRSGETITFHVSAEPEASYRILVYRIGWYGGVGARLVAASPGCESQRGGADTRPVAPADEPRPRPRRLAREPDARHPPGDWVSGYYLVHYLLTSGPYAGNSSVSWLIVRGKGRRGARRCSSRRACPRGRPTTAGAAAASTRSTAPAGTAPPRSRSTGRWSVSP